MLDTSIANVALPHIAGNLSASEDEATWVLTSYLVSNAIVLPLSGWLSLLMGRKRFYMACVAVFTLSSFPAGLRLARHAGSVPQCFRVLAAAAYSRASRRSWPIPFFRASAAWRSQFMALRLLQPRPSALRLAVGSLIISIGAGSFSSISRSACSRSF